MSVEAALNLLRTNLNYARQTVLRKAASPGMLRYAGMHAGAGALAGAIYGSTFDRDSGPGMDAFGGGLLGAAAGLGGGSAATTMLAGRGLHRVMGMASRTRVAGARHLIRSAQASRGVTDPMIGRWSMAGKVNRFMGARPGMF